MIKSIGKKLVLAFSVIVFTGCNQIDTVDYSNQRSDVNSFDFSDNLIDSKILTNSQCSTELKINFEADESLFTYLAWVNFVADLEDSEKSIPRFPEYVELLKALDKVRQDNPEMYKKHRKVYEDFLPGAGLYAKNGLLVSSSKFYGKAPEFKFYPTKQSSDLDKELAGMAPSSQILQEFHTKAGINLLWKKFLPSYINEIKKYENNVKILYKDLLCYTNMQQKYPVTIKINLVGYFGISGQTRFVEQENKFVIQINPQPEIPNQSKYNYSNTLKTFRHEFTHSLFNSTISATKEKTDLVKKLNTVKSDLNLKDIMTSPEELIARTFGDAQYTDEDYEADNMFFLTQNLMFANAYEGIQNLKQNNLPFTEQIHQMFSSYDPQKEIARWKRLEAESTNVSTQSVVKNTSNKEFLRVHLGN